MGYKYEKLRKKKEERKLERERRLESSRIGVPMRAKEFIGRDCFTGSLYKELSKVGDPKPTLQIDCEPKRGRVH